VKQADRQTPARPEAEEHAPKIQVIARAASILRALENQEDGLSLGEIALRVSLPRSTVQRIVSALAEEHFLIAASPRSRVKLGPTLIRLAQATKMEIGPIVRPYLEKLSQELKETVDLSVLQGRHAVFVDQVPGSHRLRAVSAIGERFPLHCTACGKTLLAAMSDAELDSLESKIDFTAYTENTITDMETLREELDIARKSFCALNVEEHTEGISAVGTWFSDPFGRTYAVSIPSPTVRFARNKEVFTEALLGCREEIIAMLGDRNSDSK
jgi:DNA-binding IclR family transcriptional regulator